MPILAASATLAPDLRKRQHYRAYNQNENKIRQMITFHTFTLFMKQYGSFISSKILLHQNSNVGILEVKGYTTLSSC